ncbi:MAG: trypsin-like peptidase domain-containing protein [Planctomycetota bacterium]
MSTPPTDPTTPSSAPTTRAPGRTVLGRIATLATVGLVCAALGALLTNGHVDARPPGGYLPTEARAVELFEEVSPSVVFVRTSAFERRGNLMRGVMTFERAAGAGSGFVWDNRGHIVTNYHVVEPIFDRTRDGRRVPDGRVIVQLHDGREYEAEIVGYAEYKDIAVLRIPVEQTGASLRPISPGTSGDLRVGQQVYAIGSPFGLDQTLTTGIVSALDRSISSIAGPEIDGVVQTDAAINPGNSGGPLLDSAGRLIGITTAIRSPTGSSAGIGFAVPVDTAQLIVPQLVTHGRVTRPTLGVRLATLRPRTRTERPLLVVVGVTEGSGAERAGIRGMAQDTEGMTIPGDIIVGIEDRSINDLKDLEAALERFTPGETVRVRIERYDLATRSTRTLELPVTLGAPLQ